MELIRDGDVLHSSELADPIFPELKWYLNVLTCEEKVWIDLCFFNEGFLEVLAKEKQVIDWI